MKVVSWLALILLAFGPVACNLPIGASEGPSTDSELPEAHPPAGTTMRWVDGSQLILIDMGPIQAPVWIYSAEITDQMISLCAGAGQCASALYHVIPEVDYIGESESSVDGELGAPIHEYTITVDDATAYCGWVGGRLATEEEMFRATGMSTGKRQHGTFRCVVDAPRAAAPLCQTSALYVRKHIGTPKYEDFAINSSGQFCQNGQGYATASIDIVGCETHPVVISLVGPSSIAAGGDTICEHTDDDSIVCYGTPASVASGTALAGCQGDPAVEMAARTWDVCYAGTIPYPCYDGDWMASNSPLVCPAGYESSAASPALCSWSWGLLNQGCFHSMEPMSVTGGGFACTLPSSTTEETGSQDPASAPSTVERRCIYPMCGGTGLIEAPENSALPPCPIGMYFDAELNGCISPGPFRDECLAGFEFDGSRGCCQSALPGGEYPGCQEGQAFDPATGSCDAGQIFTAEGVLVPVEFSLDLPACEGGNGAGGCQLTSAICAADGGQDFDAADCKCIPVQ